MLRNTENAARLYLTWAFWSLGREQDDFPPVLLGYEGVI